MAQQARNCAIETRSRRNLLSRYLPVCGLKVIVPRVLYVITFYFIQQFPFSASEFGLFSIVPTQTIAANWKIERNTCLVVS
jgi:hypothetical protein